jgi:chromosome segregation ATPase
VALLSSHLFDSLSSTIYTKLDELTLIADINNQSIINELQSRINLLSKEFNNLLRAKQENINEINGRRTENYNLTKTISDLYRDISNRDADIVALQKNIQNLTESVQEKQANINSLQNSLSELQRDFEDSQITPEEYEKIDNKSDYVFVKAHDRNGSHVKAHYRKRPNK